MNRNPINRVVANLLKTNPKEVHGTSNSSFSFYYRQLYMKLFSVFRFEGLPDIQDKDFLQETLFREGVMGCFIPNNSAGPILLNGSPTGYNMFYHPSQFIIANPVLGNYTLDVGVNCELLDLGHCAGDFYSFEPLVVRYATLLASIDGSLNMTLMNSRVAQVFTSDSNATLKTMQKIYDDVSEGKPAVFVAKGLRDDVELKPYFNNVKNTYIGTELLQDRQTIMNQFLTEIGINNANTQKRERLITAEADSNQGEVKAIVDEVLDRMNICFGKINAMFGTNMSVSINTKVVGDTTEEGVSSLKRGGENEPDRSDTE